MLTMQQSMNLSTEYAMFNQKNLTCYWGNRDELSDKQRKMIKELGYTYRGKNQWLYFLSFEPEDNAIVMLAEILIGFICELPIGFRQWVVHG